MQRLSQITAPLTLILKTLRSIESSTRPRKGIVGVGSDNRAGHNGSKLDGSQIDDREIDGDKVDDDFQKKSKKTSKFKNLFKFKKLSKFKKTIGFLDFLTPGARLAFTELGQAFFKAPINYHFDLKDHILIETDVLSYAIGAVLRQLTSDYLSQ